VKPSELIGRRIAAARTERGLTQAQLGELLGPWLGHAWLKQAVSQAEQGRRDFTAEELLGLSACLEQPLGFFFQGDGEGPIEFSGGMTIPARELASIVAARELTVVELERLVKAGERALSALRDVEGIVHLAEARLGLARAPRSEPKGRAEGTVVKGKRTKSLRKGDTDGTK
jgi:transcriptional regulator with XRE-family HTH domain